MANKSIIAQVRIEHCKELPEEGLMQAQQFADGSTVLINPESSDFYYVIAGDTDRIYKYNWASPVEAAMRKLDAQLNKSKLQKVK